MKILYLINSLSVGGAEMFVISLAREIQKLTDHDVVVMAIRHGYNENIFVKELKEVGVNAISGNKRDNSGFLGFNGALRSVKKLTKEYQPDIIHSHCELPDLINALISLKNGKKVRTIHSERYRGHQPEKIGRIWNDLIKNRFSAHITISGTVNDKFISVYGLTQSKTHLIPVAVDKQFYTNGSQRTLIGKTEIKFGMIGRLVRLKGHLDALQVIGEIRNLGNMVSLQIAGDGEMKDEIQKKILAQNLTYVKMVGMLDSKELVSFIRDIDILLMPSQYEGLPISMMQAMAMGVPVIGYNVSGIKDLLNLGGGELVVKDDKKMMKDKIKGIINNDAIYRKYSQEAINISMPYNIETIAKSHIALYSTLVIE
jgi:glycosyltransferase involved in cell wall biosynthesis